jgi:GT2 family glycosyltransferase
MVKRVSVIILNYNGVPFIRNLMLSLAGQTFRDFEIVFVDNGSTDDSIMILQHILKNVWCEDIKVRIITNNSNIGYCAGNNVGLKHSTGDYIVFLNNDVFVELSWLKNLVGVLNINPSVGACQSLILFAKTKEVQSAGMLFDIYGWSLGIQNIKAVNVDNVFYPMGTSVIVRKSILDLCDGFDESIFSGDYDLGWRIRLNGYRILSSVNSICHHFGGYATKTLYAHPDQFYEACRERIYVLAKNYSLSKAVFRIPVSTMLMFLASIVWCYRTRRNYLASLLKALMWNLRNLKQLTVKREKIQRDRRITDTEIEKSMSKYPLMFLLSKMSSNLIIS